MRRLRIFAIFLFYFVIHQFAHAVNPTTFVKSYNSGNIGYVVREVNASQYVVAGSTDYYYNFHWNIMSWANTTNIHFLKSDENGSLIWEKIFTYPGNRMFATDFATTIDNGFIITGRAGNDMVWPPDSNDIVLIKTDSSGNVLWSEKFDGGKDELGFSVQQTTDSGFVISAFRDTLPMSLVGNTFATLIKTDKVGVMQWAKNYQFAVRDLDTGEPFSWVVKQTMDGGYVLVGTTAASHAADILVIRVDNSGNVVWSNSYDHDNSAFRFSLGIDIIETWSGDFVIAGSLDKDQGLSQYNYPFALKISSTGTILQQRLYDSNPPQMFQSGFSSVQITPDGGLFFTGMGGYGGFGMQAQLLKTDINLVQSWSKNYTNDGLATLGSRYGRYTSDGCYIFTGKKVNSGSLLMKTDPFGNIPCKNPGTLFEIPCSMTANPKSPLVFAGINSSLIPILTSNGTSDTSIVCPNIATFLPIELISFDAKANENGNVKLSWETASEINNDHFEIERSFDGINFQSIAKIKGAGNSTTLTSYYLNDELNFSGILYYRLKQFDYDGKLSTVKTTALKLRNDGITAFAEIKKSELTLLINQSEDSNAQIELCNLTGSILFTNQLLLHEGQQKVSLSIPEISNGIYFVIISNSKTRRCLKVIAGE